MVTMQNITLLFNHNAANRATRAGGADITMRRQAALTLSGLTEHFNASFASVPFDGSNLFKFKIKAKLLRNQQEGKTLSAVGIKFTAPQRSFSRNQKSVPRICCTINLNSKLLSNVLTQTPAITDAAC